MQHIAKALKKLIKSTGLNKGLDQQKAIEVWQDVVGDKISNNTETVSVERGIITVKAKTPTWRQELYLQKEQIIKKINSKVNKKIIKDIRFI